jgi:hypothetical protein
VDEGNGPNDFAAGPGNGPDTPPRPDAATGIPGTGSHRLLWSGIALIVVAAVGGALLYIGARGGRSSTRSTAPPPKSVAPASGPHTLTGSLTYPGNCAGKLGLTIQAPTGKKLATVPFSQSASANGCEATFSTTVSAQPAYRFVLSIQDAQGNSMGAIPGPTFTNDQIAADGYDVKLTTDRFGIDPARFAVQVDLQTAINAAHTFYQGHSNTFVGLTSQAMHKLVPSLTFNTSTTVVPGQVSIRLATPVDVMFVEQAGDGTPVAMGFKPPQLECYGEIDAKTFQACIAWQPASPSPQSSPISL